MVLELQRLVKQRQTEETADQTESTDKTKEQVKHAYDKISLRKQVSDICRQIYDIK